MTSTSPPAPASRPDLGLLLILGALTAFAPMSIDMYLPALPGIASDLGSTATGAQATVAAFFVGLSAGQLLYGPLSDRRGRRGPLLFGVALYVAASALCVVAPTMTTLIVARVLQALGGCAGVVIARAVVRDRFDHADSARIFSTLMLIMGVAPILAPLVGGAVMTHLGWRAIFGLLAAFGALVGLAVALGLPESRTEATLVRARSESPLRAYLALLAQPRLLAYVLTGGLSSAAMFTYITASPDLVIGTYGVPATSFGWVFGLNAAGIIGASQLNRLLLRWLSPDRILRLTTAGAALAAAVLFATAQLGTLGLTGILVPLFFVIAAGDGVGAGEAAGALAQDPHRSGTVSALLGATQFGLGAAGAGLAGVLHDGTARPMASLIAACVAASVIAARRATQAPAKVAPGAPIA
ncbi:MAG: Bcr/CflA family efflux MFS transporter [Myxococcales bacterium]|nr:MAG: Bcr/CflA family efflux MFS transporter [Myxococcales bacterium]